MEKKSTLEYGVINYSDEELGRLLKNSELSYICLHRYSVKLFFSTEDFECRIFYFQINCFLASSFQILKKGIIYDFTDKDSLVDVIRELYDFIDLTARNIKIEEKKYIKIEFDEGYINIDLHDTESVDFTMPNFIYTY